MNLILLLSKTILISVLLTSYYWLFLRNKKFHQYNRFFLLGIPVISICLPLLNIPILGFYLSNQNAGIKLLQVVTISNWEEAIVITPHQNYLHSLLSAQNIGWTIFIVVALAMLVMFLKNIFQIRKIASIYPHTDIEGTSFYQTDEQGTPFSFLKNIFWNNNIDITSEKGRQIFRHEMYHVKQKHTADILFMEMITILFWFNPFFHLIKREIKTVHEFLANQFAISECNRHEYAELLVFSALTNYQFQIGNPFFNNQIKRRIAMLTQLKNSRYGYISRVMALPLLFILICAFAVKINAPRNFKSIHSPKPITVVIDAGHGGIFNGTRTSEADEKNINLSIAKKIALLSKDYNVNVVMTREQDVAVGNAKTIHDDLQNRIDLATENNAAAFISIHVDADVHITTEKTGFGVYVPKNNSSNYSKSTVLASAIAEELKNVYPTSEELKSREKGVAVLDKNTVPAILVEFGFINNKKDLAFISNPANQEKIARNILEGLVKYGNNKSATLDMINDTIPKSQQFQQERTDTINLIARVPHGDDTSVVYLKLRENSSIKNDFVIDTVKQKTFTKVEIEAEYPGGKKSWAEYLNKNLHYPDEAINKEIQGTVLSQFIVELDGTLTDIKIIKSPNQLLSDETLRIIKNSGKWTPAVQNGKQVRAYKRQPIVFKLDRQ